MPAARAVVRVRGQSGRNNMATKKDEPTPKPTAQVVGDSEAQIEERRKRRQEAVTVDGTESFPPPGMDLPDGGVVPLEDDTSA